MNTRDDGYTLETLPRRLRDLASWPRFDSSGLEGEDLLRFNRRVRGIQELLAGSTLKDAAISAGCSSPELSRLFARCTTFSIDAGIVGLYALTKHRRLGSYARTEALESNSKAGFFTRLLVNHASLERFLKGLITSRVGPTGKVSRKHRTEIATQFLTQCAADGLDLNAYPFDSDSKAARTVYRYIDSYLNRNFEEYDIWFGHNSTAKLKVGKGEQGFSLVSRPFDLVHIDAYRVDAIGTIQIETEHGPKLIAISRLWLVVVLDNFSGAVLGYSISYESQVSAETIERALLSTQRPWRPRRLSEGLRYHPGAGLPVGVIKGLDRCPIVTLRADNFSSHYAGLIQKTARRVLGIHINYGPIGSFFHNSPLERFFGILADRGIKILSSSLGSGPNDPLRPTAPVTASINNSVTWRLIEDVLEVELTGENVRPGSGRSGMSPLEIIGNHMASASIAFMPRPRPKPHPLGERLGYECIIATIGGSRTAGNIRRPYIELYGRRYHHPKIESDFSLIGTKVRLRVRREDCEVEAFFEDGREIGILILSRGNYRQSISLSLLKSTYNKSKNSRPNPEQWEIEQARQLLVASAILDSDARPNAVSRNATELAALESARLAAAHSALEPGSHIHVGEKADQAGPRPTDASEGENVVVANTDGVTRPDTNRIAGQLTNDAAPVNTLPVPGNIVKFSKIRRA